MSNTFQFTPTGIQAVTSEDAPSAEAFAPAVVHAVQEPAPAPPPAARARPFRTENVATLMRARLRDVEREIKRLRALEKERDELKRMLAAAAEKKPKTTVSALRRAI